MHIEQFVSAYNYNLITHIDYEFNASDKEKIKIYNELCEMELIDEFRKKRPVIVKDMEQAIKRRNKNGK